ncbi:TetR/AcrR family transcriptional regulator [Arthrobacter sp. 2RAF6]
MPKVSDDHRAERRRQIATAALHCFSRKGFEGTSMADIIAESQLSAGAIYNHYKNKHDLVERVVHDVMSGRTADLAALEKQTPLPHPATVVREFLGGLGRDLGDPSILVQVWGAAIVDAGLKEIVGELMRELIGLFERYFRAWFLKRNLSAAAARQRAKAVAPVIVGICQGYLLQAAIVPGFDGDAYLSAIELVDPDFVLIQAH